MHTIDSRYTYTGYVVVGADALRQKSVTDLPGEDRRTLPLVLRNFTDHFWRGDPRLATAYCSRSYGASLIVSAKNLAHTTVGHLHGKQKTKFTYII